MDVSVDPTIAITLLVMSCVSGAAWLALRIKRGSDASSPYDTVEKVLLALSVPLFVLGLVAAAMSMTRTKTPSRREGDEDLTPDNVPTEESESPGELVTRVVIENAEAAETHTLHEATEDEVAARGAALFDPGAPTED